MVKTYEKALQFIKIRPHHSGELTKKLLMRGFDRSEVSAAVEKLISQGLINDRQFGEMYLESLLKYKTFGFYGIKAKLMSHGIASNEAENLLNEFFTIEQEAALARKAADKSKNLDRVKLSQRLNRKGFRSAAIAQVVQGMPFEE